MLATASSIGLAVVISIFLGLGLGFWLDRRLGTKPWLTVAGLLLGVVAGFRNLWIMAERVERGQQGAGPAAGGPENALGRASGPKGPGMGAGWSSGTKGAMGPPGPHEPIGQPKPMADRPGQAQPGLDDGEGHARQGPDGMEDRLEDDLLKELEETLKD
jgi:ATP synthase protein I